jgi:phosphate transport system substrate-binding protein
MKKLAPFLATLIFCSSVVPAFADQVKIAGSGGMIPLLNELGKAYMKKNPKDTIDVEQKSLGMEGGLMKLNKGLIDIAMAAHTMTAKEKELPIVGYEISTVPGLFAVNSSVTVKELSSQQICDIYGGKITNWKQVGGKDASIVVLTRPENESTKKVMREGITCFASLKEGPAVIMVAKSTDMASQLASTPNAIGMTNAVFLEDAAGKFVAPKMDGKDLKSGWKLQHHFLLVTGKQPTDGTKRFMQFVASPEGQAAMKKERANPVPFKF